MNYNELFFGSTTNPKIRERPRRINLHTSFLSSSSDDDNDSTNDDGGSNSKKIVQDAFSTSDDDIDDFPSHIVKPRIRPIRPLIFDLPGLYSRKRSLRQERERETQQHEQEHDNNEKKLMIYNPTNNKNEGEDQFDKYLSLSSSGPSTKNNNVMAVSKKLSGIENIPLLAPFLCALEEERGNNKPKNKDINPSLTSQAQHALTKASSNNIGNVNEHKNNDKSQSILSIKPTQLQHPYEREISKAFHTHLSDHNKSTMDENKHTKYFKLLSSLISFPKNKKKNGKEIREFITNIESEQEVYRKSIHEFRLATYRRFLFGFITSDDSQLDRIGRQNALIKSKFVIESFKNRWFSNNTLPSHYKQSSYQNISLLSTGATLKEYHDVIVPPLELKIALASGRYQNSPMSILSLQSFTARVVSMNSDNDNDSDNASNADKTKHTNGCYFQDIQDILSLEGEASLPKQITFNYGTNVSSVASSLLINDNKALELATSYDASLILSDQCLTKLLQTPGLKSTVWKTHLTVSPNGIGILEDPLPQACPTRDALTEGYEESLFQYLCTKSKTSSVSYTTTSDSSTELEKDQDSVEYVYTVITLPDPKIYETSDLSSEKRHSRSTQKKSSSEIKVLVRSTNHFYIQSKKNPLKYLIKLNYDFSREENLTSYEYCRRELERMLQPTCKQIHIEINVYNGKFHVCRDVTSLKSEEKEENLTKYHFMPFLKLMYAIHQSLLSTRDTNKRSSSGPSKSKFYLLSLDRCKTSATVHEAISSQQQQLNDKISIEKELEDAKSVYTSQEALMTCFRMYKWPSHSNMYDPNNKIDTIHYPYQKSRIPFTFPFCEEMEKDAHSFHNLSSTQQVVSQQWNPTSNSEENSKDQELKNSTNQNNLQDVKMSDDTTSVATAKEDSIENEIEKEEQKDTTQAYISDSDLFSMHSNDNNNNNNNNHQSEELESQSIHKSNTDIMDNDKKQDQTMDDFSDSDGSVDSGMWFQ